jgi:hypothetical protein
LLTHKPKKMSHISGTADDNNQGDDRG